MARFTLRTTFSATRLIKGTVNVTTMRAAAKVARQDIIDRTLQGRSVSGAPFRRYAPGYDKPSPVNLKQSGDMQRALQPVQVTRNSFRLGFTDPKMAERAGFHQKGTKKMPRRRWLGMSARGKQRIVKMVQGMVRVARRMGNRAGRWS